MLQPEYPPPLCAVVRGCERPGALADCVDPTSHAAELGRASRQDSRCDRRKPVQKHAAITAPAGPEHLGPRDPISFRHSWEEGIEG